MTILEKIKRKKKLTISITFIIEVIGIIGFILMYLTYQHSLNINTVTIKQLPDKLEYFVGEEADYTGLELEVLLNNKETYIVTASDCDFMLFDTSKASESRIIIAIYKDYQCEFEIKVKNRLEFTSVLSSIVFKQLPDKLIYKVGDLINTTGGILICEYHDGSTKELELKKKYCYGFNNQKPGEYDIIVKYEENGVIVETKYTVTVVE